jgi:CBS domain-containing protein
MFKQQASTSWGEAFLGPQQQRWQKPEEELKKPFEGGRGDAGEQGAASAWQGGGGEQSQQAQGGVAAGQEQIQFSQTPVAYECSIRAPGLQRGAAQLSMTGRTLFINVPDVVSTKLEIPLDASPESASANFEWGVLKIVLQKAPRQGQQTPVQQSRGVEEPARSGREGQSSGGSASAAGTSAGAAAAATAGGPSTALSGPTKQASFAPPDVEEKDKNPLRRLLDRTTVADALKFKDKARPTGKQLISFPDDLQLHEAVSRLAKNRILSAPLFDIEGQCVGFIDVLDICAWILACFPDPNKLQEHDLQTWQNMTHKLRSTPVRELTNLSGRDPFVPIYEDQPMTSIVQEFVKGVHRVAILSRASGKFIGMFSQYDLVLWAAEQLSAKSSEVSKMGSKTMKDFGLSGRGFQIYSVTTDSKVLAAIFKLLVRGVTGLAVVDPASGKLVGNFSAADIRGLYEEQFPSLAAPVGDFLLEYSPESMKPRVERPGRTLTEIVQAFVTEHVRRFWVIDKDYKPENVISLTDIASILLRG